MENDLGDAFYKMFEFVHGIEKNEYQFKGYMGESVLDDYLEECSVPGYHKTVSNILIPAGKEKTQVDAVFISKKAIICIEFKNLGGWIFGSENQKQWTQSFAKNEKYYFYNPVLQNRVHCRALAKILSTVPENIVSLIVFSGRCQLKKINCPNTTVIRLDELDEYLYGFELNHEDRFTEKNVDAVQGLLELYKPTPEQIEEHIERVKKYTEGMECPKCGSELEMIKKQYKNGRRAYYFGCKNPNCTFTRDGTYAEVIKYGNDDDRTWAFSRLM